MEIVRYFFENLAGLDLNDIDGYTPLHIACQEGRPEVVKLLLECDLAIDINQKDQYGWTPLWFACDYACFDIVDLLMEDLRIQINQVIQIIKLSFGLQQNLEMIK